LLCHSLLFAQIDCERIASFLNEKEAQIAHFNLQDPDYIPLHYLVAKDVSKELENFKNEVIPNYSGCFLLSFNELIDRYDNLNKSIKLKYDSLRWLNENVYLIFYEKALYEYQFNNNQEAEYFLLRSLQYNETFPNAILLKLNKLLDKKHFEECLSLLNTLYYKTTLNREQEMQAIEFTDKFYHTLYQTGDSLVKIENAADALKLFEILEIFCLNLPSSYCNDDYYHGVMRSKSGIYDSYLAIAKVAEKRGNKTIATHFYQYAQEYLEANPHLQNYEPKDATEAVVEVKKVVEVKEVQVVKGSKVQVIQELKSSKVQDINVVIEEKEVKNNQEEYDQLVHRALALCRNEKFESSYQLFLEAKKIEECKCIKTDFRVALMVNELSNFLKKN
jgi:hypothetical protein